MDLHGKTVCVTGATGGIGEECAAALAGLGARVVLGVRSREKAAATMAKIRGRFPEADVVVGPPLDMRNPQTIRSFAGEWVRSGRPLHVLINNAGALAFTQESTGDGVPELCQVNYLGPYLLTRLLEGVLIRSAPSRVINVSSVTHRYGVIGDPWLDFLKGPQGHWYENTKLANVLHAYEVQRRLGHRGVQACAVDPGSVGTGIWRGSSWAQWVTCLVWAPPSAGALPLLHAATAAWDIPPPQPPPADMAGLMVRHAQQGGTGTATLRYYAPQAFALPLLTWYVPEGNTGRMGRWLLRRGIHASSLWGISKQALWLALAFIVSALDWPVRQLSKGRVWGRVVLAFSSPLSYDCRLAAQLWDASADVAGVGRGVGRVPPEVCAGPEAGK